MSKKIISNPLSNPHQRDEAVKLSLVGPSPSERRRYEQSKQAKQKKAAAMQQFLCSVILTPTGFELVKDYALHCGLNYPQAIEKAVRHCMSCFHNNVNEEEGEE